MKKNRKVINFTIALVTILGLTICNTKVLAAGESASESQCEKDMAKLGSDAKYTHGGTSVPDFDPQDSKGRIGVPSLTNPDANYVVVLHGTNTNDGSTYDIVVSFDDDVKKNLSKSGYDTISGADYGMNNPIADTRDKNANVNATKNTWEFLKQKGADDALADETGENFKYDDPLVAYMYTNGGKGVGLLDPSASVSDAEKILSENAKLNGGSGIVWEFEVAVYAEDTSNNNDPLLISTRILRENPELDERLSREGYILSFIRVADAAEGGVINDNGQINKCPDGDCPGNQTCEEKYGYEACNPTESYKCPEDVCKPITGCDKVTVPTPNVDKKDPPSNSTSGKLACGSNYTKTTYNSWSVACGLVTILQTTRTTAYIPAVDKIQYAGRGFDWGQTSSTTIVTTEVYDSAPLIAESNRLSQAVTVTEQRIKCIEGKLKDAQNKYDGIKRAYESAIRYAHSCPSSCPSGPNSNDTEEVKKAKEKARETCLNTCPSVYQVNQEYLGQLKQYNDEINNLKQQQEEAKGDLELARAEQQQFKQTCEAEFSTYRNSTSKTGSSATLTNQQMVLTDKKNTQYARYTQKINDVAAIAKNSGKLLNETQKQEMIRSGSYAFIENNKNFFIPWDVSNKTTGYVSADIMGETVTCPFDVRNYVVCNAEDNCDGLRIIYRPISLNDPFPDTVNGNEYRKMGSNWNVAYADNLIKQNRNVSTYDVYNLTPLYTITLTPSTIKDIRKNYNKTHSFNDFEMTCNEDGYLCTSDFLWRSEYTSMIDQSNSCANESGWDQNCYNGGVSE